MSELEVKDQLAGVRFLKAQSFVDGENIGIYGHSYGGYMTLMCLLRAQKDSFIRAGASGAPVTHWKWYDTHYTERYMSTPQENADNYEKSSVFPYLKDYDDKRSKLLMYHGMADDNVLFVNSTAGIALVEGEG